MTATNEEGDDTETKTDYITVNAQGLSPVAAFTADTTNITAGDSISFADQSTGDPTSWTWDFGDGGTSTKQSPVYKYDTVGSYTVKLTVSNEEGDDTETKTNYIAVSAKGSAPVAAFVADTTQITAGEEVTFTGQSVGEPTSWNWDFGDGGTSTVQNPTYTYNTAGTYTVALTVTNDYGEDIETKANYITVAEQGTVPVASFTADVTEVTAGEAISFTDESTGEPTIWSWDFGDGSTSTEQNPIYTYNAVGTYTVVLTVTNDYGSDTETKVDYVTIIVESSTVTDIDGNEYKTVIIGDQTWMAENLKVTHYASGTSISLVTDRDEWKNFSNSKKAYCFYDNDESLGYGALYTYAAATNGDSSGSNVQGVCPDGWHLPSDSEWTVLEDYISDDGHSGSEGTALKASSGWADDGDGTDNYSFNALPGGCRYKTNGAFSNGGSFGYWWTSTIYYFDNSYAYDRSLYNTNEAVIKNNIGKSYGLSVRCVKD